MFSIGIPAFKANDLKECIDSVLSQTFEDFELIIVNDNSPQPLDEIIETYSDSRIQYHKNIKNFGAENVVDNWNKCLSFAKGDFFILMGDDDTMAPEYLEEFTKLIRKYPELDVYHCRSIIIDSVSVPIRTTPLYPDYQDIYDYLANCLSGKTEQFVSDFVYRTVALRQHGGFYKLPLAWASDYLTSIVMAQEKGIAYTSRPIFNYRFHVNTITTTGNVDKKHDALATYHNWIKAFLSVQPRDPHLLLKYQSLQTSLEDAVNAQKLNIIRSTVGRHRLMTGLFKCLINAKKYNLTIKDFIRSIAASVLSKY